MSPPSESSRSFISESCHMCSVQNLLNSFPLFVASRPQTLMQWWVNHLHLSLSSGEGLVSQKETSASPEIIPRSTLGLGLIWCVGQDHVKERIFVTSSGILGCDRPTAIPRRIHSASACWVWLMPPVTLSWPRRPRKCFPTKTWLISLRKSLPTWRTVSPLCGDHNLAFTQVELA